MYGYLTFVWLWSIFILKNHIKLVTMHNPMKNIFCVSYATLEFVLSDWLKLVPLLEAANCYALILASC